MEERTDEPRERMSVQLLSHIEGLGDGSSYTGQIFALVDHSSFFAEFTREDIELLAGYMHVYRAQAGQAVIREGDDGDFMLLIVSGTVDIFKSSAEGEQQLMSSVGPGMTIGEMSMIDGEPRFATCIATDTTVFAVLTRDAMAKIILERPSLGTKILIVLVTMLTHRLRQTSARLLHYMERPLAF